MKHPNHIICFTFCLIILIMFVACTKEGRHYSVSQEFKDYFLFQKGSYWIYKNDSTNSIDCTYLATQPSFEIYKTGDHQKSDPSIEDYELLFTFVIFKGFEIFSKTDSHNYLLFYINSEPDAFGMINQLIPDSNYYFESRPQGYFKVWPFILSFDVNAITFYQVLNSRFNNTKKENTFNFYFAKHFGLIKLFGKWGNQNQSWSLVRYHIVQ